MAEWTHLPKDLIELISKCLDTSTDLLRFRSVCNSWRSSIPPKSPRLSSNTFKILPNDDLMNLRIRELGHEYVLHHVSYKPNSSSFTDADLGLVGDPVFGGDKKYLVESKGDLLLVDMYLSIDTDEGLSIGNDVVQDLVQYMSERTVRFKVFKLNEEGKSWIEVKNLEDRVLFLGDDSTFSASASELSGCKGNCIFFEDNFFYSREEGDDGSMIGRDIGVFELESGCIGPLRNFPDYSKMFWPPPDWVASTSLEISQLVRLAVWMCFSASCLDSCVSKWPLESQVRHSVMPFLRRSIYRRLDSGAESKPAGRAVDREVSNSSPFHGRSDKISAELGPRIPVH
ncbi:hypothetical protein D5086_018678 [Populus alba]|uniref:Uncharacterized protein n=1 Tax=Populus alba TaxID=43335 RepID=A0ACC4BQC6_POPAL